MRKTLSVEALKKITVLLVLLLILLAVLLFFLFAGRKKAVVQESTGYVMGSFMMQTVYCQEGSGAPAAAQDAATQLENLISWRIEGSDIYRLNEKAGNGFESIDSRTRSVLESALQVAQFSSGAFDPTILPVSSLWNFDSESPKVPSQTMISHFAQYVDYESLVLSAQGAFLEQEGMGIDLGAVGKGAACDEALKIYEEYGVEGAVVSVGGSIGVYGEKPDGGAWKIAVRDPLGEINDQLGILTIEEGCVSTSGSYEKYFEEDGVRYHHILDTQTGYPAESDLISVTVVHESGTVSDALSTACFALGLESSRPLLEKMEASAVFVDGNRQVTIVGDLQFTLSAGDYTLCTE